MGLFKYFCMLQVKRTITKLNAIPIEQNWSVWRLMSSDTTVYSHVPVMQKEVIESLNPQNNEIYIDMTFGAGGHSHQLLNSASGIKLYCVDRDPKAYDFATSFAKQFSPQVTPLLGKFTELQTLLDKCGVKKNTIDGIIFDIGCSSMQLDDPTRGFSISKNSLLDMRMDGNRYDDQPTAADVLNTLDVPNLAKIFKIYGQEKHAKKIAQAIIDARYMMKEIRTTKELADLVISAVGSDHRTDKLQRHAHVATKVFQALRIFVNNELNELNNGMEIAHSYLKPGGRLVTLTFHSLEDRIVKRHIHDTDMDEPVSHSMSQKYRNAAKWHTANEMNVIMEKKWKSLYKHVLTPTEEEVYSNPRSRSAKLRAAIKLC